MKSQKENIAEIHTNEDVPKKMVNPFVKLIKDKERIANAVQNGQPLSSLKDIKFVSPI
jgi:hypothetical protein